MAGCGSPARSVKNYPCSTGFRSMGRWPDRPYIRENRRFFNDVSSIGLDYLRELGINTLLAAPLKVESTIIGVLDVINKVGGFTKEDLRIISLFADQAAIVIDQTQLHQQVEQMAVMEERQRLSRELHDLSPRLCTASTYTLKQPAEPLRW